LELVFLSTNICAALPLKKAAEQQNICSQVITMMAKSCRAANPEGLDEVKYQTNFRADI
jgi:hypothetical protein